MNSNIAEIGTEFGFHVVLNPGIQGLAAAACTVNFFRNVVFYCGGLVGCALGHHAAAHHPLDRPVAISLNGCSALEVV